MKGSKPAPKRGGKGDDPGLKMQRGKPVPAAFSKDKPPSPDTGSMPGSVTRGVPTPATLGKGLLSGINNGPTTYTPNARKSDIQRFTNTDANRRAGAVGRVVNPSHIGQIGGVDPNRDAMRRGFPQEAEFDKSPLSRAKLATESFNEATKMGLSKMGGKGDAGFKKKPVPKKKGR